MHYFYRTKNSLLAKMNGLNNYKKIMINKFISEIFYYII